MFISGTIIAIIFRLFNFGLIIVLSLYVFKKYILDNIVVTMTKKESEKEFLLNQQQLFGQKRLALQELVQNDTILCKQLKFKIDEWKRIATEEDMLQKKKSIERKDEIKKKYLKKRELQQKVLIQLRVADKIASDLQESLSEYFKNDRVGEKYLKEIVHFMHERRL